MKKDPAMPSVFVTEHTCQPAPEIQAWLNLVNRLGNDLDTMTRETVATVRFVRELRAQTLLWQVPVQAVRDLVVPGQEHSPVARLYTPQDRQLAKAGKLPVVIFFHGGGWTLGNPGLYDPVTRALARQIPALVLSIDYRLAPEHPFPAAIQDADTMVQWVLGHAEDFGGDSARIVLAGDSAGGTLATVAARHTRPQNRPSLKLQVLFYPSVNISSLDYDSYRQFGENYLLTRKAVEKFREFYLPNPIDWTSPDASPLLAEDLRDMPPTLLISAGCDPLRDEGLAYVQKLREQGNNVKYRLEPQLTHAFLNLYNLEPSCSPYAEGVLGYAAGVIRDAVR